MRPALKMMMAAQPRHEPGKQMHYGHEGEYRHEDTWGDRTDTRREGVMPPEQIHDMRRGHVKLEENVHPWEDMRFRDRHGRNRYNDGRYAPESRYYPPEYEHHSMPDEMERHAGYIHAPPHDFPELPQIGELEHRIGFSMEGKAHGGEALAFPGQRMMSKSSPRPLDKATAEKWVTGMQNEDGTKGAHWKMEQTEQVRRQKGLDCDPLEFWVAMNAAYSDLSKLAKKHNVNNMDYYVDYVLAYWFKDKDAVDNKLAAYYDSVVKK